MGTYRVKLRLLTEEIEINAVDEDVVLSQIHKRYGPGRVEKITLVDTPVNITKSVPAKSGDSTMKSFILSTARPLPVIILADTSGSMEVGGKINILNDAIAEMISTFADEEDTRAEIQVSIITFGGNEARIHTNLMPASQVTWQAMTAAGRTPMGAAFSLAQSIIENHDIIPSRAYRAALILVSDGVPTDDWKEQLHKLLTSDRASKATRFAMGIGEDAEIAILSAFLEDPNAKVFSAHEVREIKKFFRWVSMSVTSRSRSVNPNGVVEIDPSEIYDFDF